MGEQVKQEKTQEEAKPEEKKEETKEEPKPPSPLVLFVDLHCVGCAKKIERSIVKISGVEGVVIDMVKNQITVKGVVEAQAVCNKITKKTKRSVKVLSPLPESEGEAMSEVVASQKDSPSGAMVLADSSSSLLVKAAPPKHQAPATSSSVDPLPQGVDPPSVVLEETLVSSSGGEGPPCPAKGKSPQVMEEIRGAPEFPTTGDEESDNILNSIQDLFTSWARMKTSSASSSIPAHEDMTLLKQALFEYVSFMDMEIGRASAAQQKAKLDMLSANLLQVLSLPSLSISTDFKVKLRVLHTDIVSLLAKNAELKTRSAQYFRASSEKESLLQEIDRNHADWTEVSSELIVEDSLMLSLTAEMKELQAKMNDCMARIAAKRRTASQGIAKTKSLLEQYQKLEVDDDLVAEFGILFSRQGEEWDRLRQQMRSAWGDL